MKRTILFLLLIFGLLLTGCKKKTEDKVLTEAELNEAFTLLKIPDETYLDLPIPKTFEYKGATIEVTMIPQKDDIISSEGKILKRDKVYSLVLDFYLTQKDTQITISKRVTLIGDEEYKRFLTVTDLPKEHKGYLSIPQSFRDKKLDWQISDSIIDSAGAITRPITEDHVVDFTLNRQGYPTVKKTVKLLKMTSQEMINDTLNHFTVPNLIYDNQEIDFKLRYGLKGTLISGDEDLYKIENNKVQVLKSEKTQSLLKLEIDKQMKAYEVNVMKQPNLIVDKKLDGTYTDVVKTSEGFLKLDENKNLGTWVSPEYDTLNFRKVLVSWITTTDKTNSVEVFIRGYNSRNEWSKWFSFGEWGLGRVNKSRPYEEDNTSGFVFETEWMHRLNSVNVSKVQLKVILKKEKEVSPVLRGVAMTFIFDEDIVHEISVKDLPNKKVYEVPKLYQRSVPEIGNIICSPTSSTMLLMYKGHKIEEWAKDPNNITSYDKNFPHGNFARYTQDHVTAGFYGNWVYNTAAISGFNEFSYVVAYTSLNGLVNHLAKIGPVAISVTGKIVGESGIVWSTDGHLLVIKGYEYVGDKLYFIANDPAIRPVEERYSAENLYNIWLKTKKYIVYAVE